MKNKILLKSVIFLFMSSVLIFILFFKKDEIKYSDVKVAILDSGINVNNSIYQNYNTFTDSNETNDLFNHGTKIYNTIKKVAPKNQNVKYYDIQVLDKNGLGTVESVCKGIEKSIEYKVDIISMSLGFNKNSKKLHECIKKAAEKNIIIVAASGDTLSSNTDFPANYQEVISVAAIDKSNNLFSFSSTGKIDFVSQGVDFSTKDNEGKTTKESGSSIAAAHFTGLLLSQFTSNNTIKHINSIKESNKEDILIEGRILHKIRYNE